MSPTRSLRRRGRGAIAGTVEAERLGGLEVDDKLELWSVAGLVGRAGFSPLRISASIDAELARRCRDDRLRSSSGRQLTANSRNWERARNRMVRMPMRRNCSLLVSEKRIGRAIRAHRPAAAPRSAKAASKSRLRCWLCSTYGAAAPERSRRSLLQVSFSTQLGDFRAGRIDTKRGDRLRRWAPSSRSSSSRFDERRFGV